MVESVSDTNNTIEEMSKVENLSSSSNAPNGKNGSRSATLWWFTLFLLTAAGLWFALWYFYLQYHETTDDAYANGNYLNVNSVISGAVIAYYADDTDRVTEGQLLVQLDPTNYQAIYEKELATLAQVTLGVKQLYNNVKGQIAEVKNQQTVLARMKFNYDNRLKLKETNPEAVAEEDFVHSQQHFIEAQYGLEQAKSKLGAALALAGNTEPENHPLIEKQKAIF